MPALTAIFIKKEPSFGNKYLSKIRISKKKAIKNGIAFFLNLFLNIKAIQTITTGKYFASTILKA